MGDIPRVFVLGFWSCFLAFGAGSAASNWLMDSVSKAPRSVDIPFLGESQVQSKKDIPFLLTAEGQHVSIRNKLWYIELLRMITENGMFVFFLIGMLSGVTR